MTGTKNRSYTSSQMRNISDKSSRENHNTHFMFSNFFQKKSCPLWEDVEKYGGARPQQTLWRMRVLCLINRATRAQAYARGRASTSTPTPICTHPSAHTHTQTHKYIILNAFHGNNCFVMTPLLRFTFIACLVIFHFPLPATQQNKTPYITSVFVHRNLWLCT
jgi:hypothetical protein